MAKIPLNRRVNAFARQSPQPQSIESYDDLHEGPIHPSQITKNGTALFNFINSLAREVSINEENELVAACAAKGKHRNAFYHSKLPELERVGQDMAEMLNAGDRQRQMQQQQTQVIQVPLEDLLNGDKAFRNLTQGSRRPAYENNKPTTNESKTMSDIDISEYLGGSQRAVSQQSNNTFYVNMDKTTKALLAEQVKTNKLLGVLVQSVRDNGMKIDELPQHLAELLEAAKIDTTIEADDIEESADLDNLLP